MDPIFWATVAGVAATIVAVPLTLWGGMHIERFRRSSDIDRSLGRVEGRMMKSGNGGSDNNLFLMVGSLQSDVRNLATDVTEIKNSQTENRNKLNKESEAEKRALGGISRELTTLRKDFKALQNKVAQLVTQISNIKGKQES